MSWDDYDEEWPDTETEQERKEREEREQQYQIALRVKQRSCPHANAIAIGSGFELSAQGQTRRYVTLYCDDCRLQWDKDEALPGTTSLAENDKRNLEALLYPPTADLREQVRELQRTVAELAHRIERLEATP